MERSFDWDAFLSCRPRTLDCLCETGVRLSCIVVFSFFLVLLILVCLVHGNDAANSSDPDDHRSEFVMAMPFLLAPMACICCCCQIWSASRSFQMFRRRASTVRLVEVYEHRSPDEG